MIDAHNEYTHGLAMDQRMRHAPKSSSQNGWDLRPYEEKPSLRPWFLVAIALAGLVAMCALAAQGGMA